MAAQTSNELNFRFWAFLQVGCGGLRFEKRCTRLSHLRFWHRKQLEAIAAAAVVLPTHCGFWLREGVGVFSVFEEEGMITG